MTDISKLGREPVVVLELDLDFCQETFGVGSCTAGQVASGTAQSGTANTIVLDSSDTSSAGTYDDGNHILKITAGTGSGTEANIIDHSGSPLTVTLDASYSPALDNTTQYTIHDKADSAACFNTRATCLDTDNYNRGTKTYRFCSEHLEPPPGIGMIPCLKHDSVDKAPTKMTPGEGLGHRASVSYTVRDFPHHDRGIDPYVENRNYDPEDNGTFWPRFLRRNIHHAGRFMRERIGYKTDPWDWNEFTDYLYVIDRITGPRKRGAEHTYTVKGKDLLELADNLKVKIPEASDATLDSGVNFTASPVPTSLTLTSGSTLSNFPAGGGTIRIGDHIMTYASRGSPENVLTGITVAQHGTEASDHEAGDTVQFCKTWDSTNVVHILYDILFNHVGIDSSYIPYAGTADPDIASPEPAIIWEQWDAEYKKWLTANTVTVVISEPTGAKDLIERLCKDHQFQAFWDEEEQKIKIRSNTPRTVDAASGFEDPIEINETHLIKESLELERLPELRLSRVLIYYDKINKAEGDDVENYKVGYLQVDSTKESADLYDESKQEEIKSLFLDTSSGSIVSQSAQRLLQRFGDTPRKATFTLDAQKAADINVGDMVDITSGQIQDIYGNSSTTRFQILSRDEIEPGHKVEFEGLEFVFTNRQGFIGPDTLNSYGSESDANKSAYAFIVDETTGVFSDGGDPYTII